MLFLLAIPAGLMILLVLLLASRRTIHQRRTVLVHARLDTAWDTIGDFPALLTNYGRVREFGAFEEICFIRGDSETAGSIWSARGRWGSTPYRADIKLVRYLPGREIAVTLVRDSFGTHRRVRDHLGILTLEPGDSDTCKLTWELRARVRFGRLLAGRIFFMERTQARLLDLGLRALKLGIDAEECDRSGGDAAALMVNQSESSETAPDDSSIQSPAPDQAKDTSDLSR